jgi:hypothetical protein
LKSCIEINSADPKIATELISQELKNQDSLVENIKNKIKVQNLIPNYSRRLLAADSGFNNAYESPFTVIKSAVVDDEINIETSKKMYLFHANNYSSERLKRLMMQVNLYQAITKKIENITESSLFLVDGTITLSVFTPTLKDGKEYQKLFSSFAEFLNAQAVHSYLEVLVLSIFTIFTSLTLFSKRVEITYPLFQ